MFDLSQVEAQKEVTPGDHPARIVDAEVKTSKTGGQYLKIKVVLEDLNENVFDNFSLEVQPDKKPIGLMRLKTLATVCGVANPNKFEIIELGGKQFTAHIKIVNDEKYGQQAKITNYKPYKKEDDIVL